MLDNNENVVVETTENVGEQATEKLVEGAKVTTGDNAGENTGDNAEKLYSQADLDRMINEKVDELLPRKLERAKAKLTREYEDKYSRVETVLNAGLGTNNLDEATNKLADFYKQKGIKIPEQPRYSERDLDLLANAEADEIIKLGFDEIVEETDRLADKGIDRMTAREKLVFTKLAEVRQRQESIRELAKIGVKEDALEDKAYQDFASKLNPDLSPKEKYEMYIKFNPKPKVEPIGSMKGATSKDKGVKDFYTYEESLQFTKEDFDKNPELFKAVEKSMLKW